MQISTGALESTVISHGLPYPHNLRLALRLEEIVREGGATPVTVGIIAGEIIVGLSHAQIEHLVTAPRFRADELIGDSEGVIEYKSRCSERRFHATKRRAGAAPDQSALAA